jgi:hypothetical protein
MSEAFSGKQFSIHIDKVEFSNELLTVYLSDERIISVPLKRFPKLYSTINSSNSDFANDFKITSSGYGIHWPKLDEDISIKAFL